MNDNQHCKHQNLVLIVSNDKKLRCRHCHLTINKQEIGDGYCPECYDAHGVKRYDFEQIQADEGDKPHYRCENCGTKIIV